MSLDPQGTPLVLIFGRRSGTSSLAKALFEIGYPLRGPLDTRPFETQPDGHYENIFARGINGNFLEQFNLRAGVPGLVPFQRCPQLTAWVNKFPDPFIVKDPGLDMAWPIWVRSLPHRRLIGIWCYRDPQEQAESLTKRYNIPPDNARWAVTMYDICVKAAAAHIETLRVDLVDPARVRRAISFLDVYSIYPDRNQAPVFEEAQCPS